MKGKMEKRIFSLHYYMYIIAVIIIVGFNTDIGCILLVGIITSHTILKNKKYFARDNSLKLKYYCQIILFFGFLLVINLTQFSRYKNLYGVLSLDDVWFYLGIVISLGAIIGSLLNIVCLSIYYKFFSDRGYEVDNEQDGNRPSNRI